MKFANGYKSRFTSYQEARHYIVDLGGDLRALSAEAAELLQDEAARLGDTEMFEAIEPIWG